MTLVQNCARSENYAYSSLFINNDPEIAILCRLNGHEYRACVYYLTPALGQLDKSACQRVWCFLEVYRI